MSETIPSEGLEPESAQDTDLLVGRMTQGGNKPTPEGLKEIKTFIDARIATTAIALATDCFIINTRGPIDSALDTTWPHCKFTEESRLTGHSLDLAAARVMYEQDLYLEYELVHGVVMTVQAVDNTNLPDLFKEKAKAKDKDGEAKDKDDEDEDEDEGVVVAQREVFVPLQDTRRLLVSEQAYSEFRRQSEL